MADAAANETKLKAAIAYITSKRAVGKVKLFKLLYLADFTAYVELGAPITGDTYKNFEMGPVPVTLWHNFERIIPQCANIELVDAGMPQPEQQIRAKPDADVSDLSPEERAVLDKIDERYGPLSGAELKRLTHAEAPYRATSRGDLIPYFMAAYRNARKPTTDEIAQILADKPLMLELRKKLAERRS
jgi:uncharacterized phage-associated protein